MLSYTTAPGRDVRRYVLASGWSLNEDSEVPAPAEPYWTDGTLALSKDCDDGSSYRLSFAGLPSFEVDFAAREIGIASASTCSPETARHLLLDQVYPRILAHEGQFVLHAAAVEMDGGVVLFLGPSGSGKSTLAASFASAGLRLLGDDAICLFREGPAVVARAVYPSLRLFEDSLAHILGASARTTPVADYLDKWNVEDVANEDGDEPLRLAAVVLIDSASSDRITLEPAQGAAACMAIVEQSFALDPTDALRARQRLAFTGDVARDVPVLRLGYPRQYANLPAVRSAVAESISKLTRA